MGQIVSKYRRQSETSFALGATLVFELIESKSITLTRVFLSTRTDSEIEEKLRAKCKGLNVEFIVSDKAINLLSDKDNCFVIGEFKKFESKLLENKPHILLVNPSNSGNLGTIMRSAVGFGVSNLAIITPSVDVYDPKTIRSSMGSIFKCRTECFEDFESYCLKYSNRSFYPFMLKTENDLRESQISSKEKVTLIFGNEATGLSDDFLSIGTPLRIFHSNQIDSLNLQTAVSLALFELTKNKKF